MIINVPFIDVLAYCVASRELLVPPPPQYWGMGVPTGGDEASSRLGHYSLYFFVFTTYLIDHWLTNLTHIVKQ